MLVGVGEGGQVEPQIFLAVPKGVRPLANGKKN
jgi:hypothetical protein